jgi:hypothetical protein
MTDMEILIKGMREMKYDLEDSSLILEDKSSGRKFRVITIDILKIIPEEIKLLLDIWRIDEINKLNKTNNQENNPANYRDLEDIASLNKKAEDFINDITEGDYYNPAILNTVKDAFRDGRSTEENKLVKLKPVERYSANRAVKISVPVNKRYFSNFGLARQPIWFAAGGSSFFQAHSLILLFDPHSAKFKEAITEIVEYAGSGSYPHFNYNCIADRHNENFEELYKKAIDCAYQNQTGGMALRFKDGADIDNIAKWIVDLQRGILIRIEEVESTNNQNG